ncbi:MAG: hypothetical protein RR271_05465 [Oscillospiraceae bacterium]
MMDSEDMGLTIQQLEILNAAKPYTSEEMHVLDDDKDPIRLAATMKAYGEKLEREGRKR